MSEIDQLMMLAQKQLSEHAAWLATEIGKIPSTTMTSDAAHALLAHQVGEIRLRVVRADNGKVSVVWDYPDELIAFLRSDAAPQHLRDTLAGARIVSIDQPASSLRRES